MELINLNEPAFPTIIDTTQLWQLYCEKVRRINTAMEMLKKEQMCYTVGNPKA